MKLNKKAIFWDNDGILVDTEKYYFQATREIFAQLDFDLTEELFIEYFLKNSSGAWHLLNDNHLKGQSISTLRDRRNNLYKSYLVEKPILIDGITDVVRKLSERYIMAIVTSSKKVHFDVIHQRTNLLKYFKFVLTREDYQNSKPDPEPYLTAWEKSGYLKEECVIIEDSERGLKASSAAGIDCVVIPTDLTKESNFEGAKLRLNSASELFDYI